MSEEGWEKFDEELQHIQDFYKTGGRYYKRHLGQPYQINAMQELLEQLRWEFFYLDGKSFSILELGPQGGRWTNQMLTSIGECGYPSNLIYDIIGFGAESELVRRDVLYYRFTDPISQEGFKYGKNYRIRSGGKITLICNFLSNFYETTKLETTGQDGRPFILDRYYNLILCLDNFCNLPETVCVDLLSELSDYLYPGSPLLFNMDRTGWPNTQELLNELDFTVHYSTVIADDIYVLTKKKLQTYLPQG